MLLKEQEVAIFPGDAFGASGEGYARISYAYSVEHLETAMRLSLIHIFPPLAALTFAASSIICAFGLASAAPRSPYRHLELCGIALIK